MEELEGSSPKIPCEKDIAWFAGFFDGEGCVTFRIDARHYYKNPRYVMEIRLANTHLPSIERAKSMWGVGRIEQKSSGKTRKKMIFDYKVKTNEALLILETIMPHLTTKKADAEIGIAYQKWKNAEMKFWGKRRPERSHVKETEARDLLREVRNGGRYDLKGQPLPLPEKQIMDILEEKDKRLMLFS